MKPRNIIIICAGITASALMVVFIRDFHVDKKANISVVRPLPSISSTVVQKDRGKPLCQGEIYWQDLPKNCLLKIDNGLKVREQTAAGVIVVTFSSERFPILVEHNTVDNSKMPDGELSSGLFEYAGTYQYNGRVIARIRRM